MSGTSPRSDTVLHSLPPRLCWSSIASSPPSRMRSICQRGRSAPNRCFSPVAASTCSSSSSGRPSSDIGDGQGGDLPSDARTGLVRNFGIPSLASRRAATLRCLRTALRRSRQGISNLISMLLEIR
eukprot:3164267-Pleurochrysis_carterae.AAC.7